MKLESFKYFYPEKPKLIHVDQPLFETLSESKDWVAEKKYNGQRLLLHYIVEPVKPLPATHLFPFQFWGRYGEKLTYKPNTEIKEALRALLLKGYCLFDGELRHGKVTGIKDRIILYDVFIWRNELLINKPFWYRRNLLKKILECEEEPIGITEQFRENFRVLFDTVTKSPEIEGLVMKNTKGMLNLGRTAALNSKWMYKVRKGNGSYRF